MMSLVIVETVAKQPLTDEVLYDADQRVLPCLAARNATWRYSLLSCDRHRMVCIFDAPDAESVRESYRRAGPPSRHVWVGELPSRSIWAGTLIQPEAAQTPRDLTTRYVVEGIYPPLSETDWNTISHKFLHFCAEHNITWLQSYLSLDRTKVIYELNVPDATLTETLHKLEIPDDYLFGELRSDRIWSAHLLMP